MMLFLRHDVATCLDSSLPLDIGPLLVFLLEAPLHPRDRESGPEACPDERESPSNNVGSVSVDGKYDGNGDCSTDDGANGPEKGQTVKHLAEGFAGLVAEVQSLAELGATRAVHSADVLDVGVDSRSEGSADGERRNPARGWDTPDAEDIDQEKFHADGEDHGGCGNGQQSDGWVMGTCAGNQFDHDKEPSNREIPVKPIQIPSVRANNSAAGILLE